MLPLSRYPLVDTADLTAATKIVSRMFDGTKGLRGYGHDGPISLQANYFALGANRFSAIRTSGHALVNEDPEVRNIFLCRSKSAEFETRLQKQAFGSR